MNSVEEHQRVIAALPIKSIEAAAKLIAATLEFGKLLICGNGGSAADAQHMAAEMIGRFHKERGPLPAIALTTDTSILTAVGNDYGFDAVFERQVIGLGRPEDCLLAISTSGNSQNVCKAVAAAKAIGMSTIALTGMSGALLYQTDIAISIESTNAARIQEAHILCLHMLCEALE